MFDSYSSVRLTAEYAVSSPMVNRSGPGTFVPVKRNLPSRGEMMSSVVPSRLAPPPFMPEERRAEERERLSRMSVDAFIGIAKGIEAWPGTRGRIESLRVPTLVMCGELDVAFVRAIQRLGEKILGAVTEIIPQAAHSPQYERPELLNAALRAHLERNAVAPK